MPLQEQIMADLKAALRAGDKASLSVLRLIVSGINYAQIDKGGSLDDAGVLGVIAKEARQRRESIEAFRQGNRPDLVAKEETELAILLKYLPQQMSREEIVAAARRVIQETGARGPQDKGKVMGRLVAELKGRAEGREINAVVTELLAKGS